MSPEKIVSKTIIINAKPLKVWEALTNSASLKQWLSEAGMDVVSDWKTGSSFVFKNNANGVAYSDKGKVLQADKGKVLQYNYWSEISELPDRPENYSLVEFRLGPMGDETMLSLKHSNFAKDEMYGDSNSYWNTALARMKKLVEA